MEISVFSATSSEPSLFSTSGRISMDVWARRLPAAWAIIAPAVTDSSL